MRTFNTSGPCDPDKHYTVMREKLVEVGQGLVDNGHYFTIFAPRQTGKTTYFQLLFRVLEVEGYVPIWVSFESYKNISLEKFYPAFGRQLKRTLALFDIHLDQPITDHIELQDFLEDLRSQTDKIVLVIDEFEDTPDVVMGELLHSFRKIYHQRQFYALHSMILVGVSTLAELIDISASSSPFNIVTELELPSFTLEETTSLIQQYTDDSGQTFETEVIKAIYDKTQGQPGMVCTLCHHLIQAKSDCCQPIEMADFYTTLKYFTIEHLDKNILNIIQNDTQTFASRKSSYLL